MQKKVKTGQGALARQLCRDAERKITVFYPESGRGFKSHSPSCANLWAQRPTAPWEAVFISCSWLGSCYREMQSFAFTNYCNCANILSQNHLGDSPWRQLIKWLHQHSAWDWEWVFLICGTRIVSKVSSDLHCWSRHVISSRFLHRAQDSSNDLAYVLYQKRKISTTDVA